MPGTIPPARAERIKKVARWVRRALYLRAAGTPETRVHPQLSLATRSGTNDMGGADVGETDSGDPQLWLPVGPVSARLAVPTCFSNPEINLDPGALRSITVLS